MSFEGYSPAALDFLWGIRFNNERGWFLAHKEDYQSHVLAPTRALGEQVYDAMHEKYPHEPFLLKMSRIYRDARRLHGQGPYKDHLWFCIRAGGEDWTGRPTFYFEVAPDYYSYGMGFWAPKAALMEAYRRRIDLHPAGAGKAGAEIQQADAVRPHRAGVQAQKGRDFPAAGAVVQPQIPELPARAAAGRAAVLPGAGAGHHHWL